jgi:hypothetical protein
MAGSIFLDVRQEDRQEPSGGLYFLVPFHEILTIMTIFSFQRTPRGLPGEMGIVTAQGAANN